VNLGHDRDLQVNEKLYIGNCCQLASDQPIKQYSRVKNAIPYTTNRHRC
jgi:hypothetical protein